MATTLNVRPGQTVRFIYAGGSNPNTQRVVEVQAVDANHINGQDLVAGEYRSFLRNRIVNDDAVVIVHEYEEVIRPESLLVNPQGVDASNLVKIFSVIHPQRTGVRYEPALGAIVCRRNDLPRLELVVGEKESSIVFVNEDGKKLGLSFTYPAQTTTFNMTCPMDSSKLDVFAGELVEHLTRRKGSGFSTKVEGWDEHVACQAAAGNPLYKAN